MDSSKLLQSLRDKISDINNLNQALQSILNQVDIDYSEKQKKSHLECIYGDEFNLSSSWYAENSAIINQYVKREGENFSLQALITCQEYSTKDIQTFDGTITLGDMVFIAIFMELIKPKKVYEIGVASGYSSAFILKLGQSLNLISNNDIFLRSHDLLYLHSKSEDGQNNIIGQVVDRYFPELTSSWELNHSTTSFDLKYEELEHGNSLFFVDGGHEHPWPLIDIINIFEKSKDHNSWILLQDNRVIERWYQDVCKYNTEMLAPVRGVEIPFLYWPGKKVSGKSGSYNMCAINLDVSEKMFSEFVKIL